MSGPHQQPEPVRRHREHDPEPRNAVHRDEMLLAECVAEDHGPHDDVSDADRAEHEEERRDGADPLTKRGRRWRWRYGEQLDSDEQRREQDAMLLRETRGGV